MKSLGVLSLVAASCLLAQMLPQAIQKPQVIYRDKPAPVMWIRCDKEEINRICNARRKSI